MKKCFKCNQEKPFTEFYKHPKMGDGYLKKCKSCTKKDIADNIEKKKKSDPNFIESERLRGREKYHRLYSENPSFSVDEQYRIIPMTKDEYKESQDKNRKKYMEMYPERKRESVIRYQSKYPEKKKCKNLSGHLKPIVEGNHLHHWSYNIEHAKDIIELDMAAHYKAHRFIQYDQERMMYRRIDTMELLDTKESHLAYITDCIATKPD